MSFAPIPELLDELRAGRMVVIVDDEDRENEGDLIMAAELVRAGRHQLHGHPRARPGVPVADPRALPPARPAADGARQHLAARHQLHRVDRGRRRRHHRHLRLRPRAHDPHGGAPGCAAARPVAARPHLPADGAARRRAQSRRPYRSGERPGAARRVRTGRRAGRDPQSRRHRWRGGRNWRCSRASTA